MPNTNKLDYLKIEYIYIIILVFLIQKLVKSFIFLVIKSQYYVIVIVLCKQHFKHIFVLIANDKKVAKCI